MKFIATDYQVQCIAAKAVNASREVGLGVLATQHRDFKPEDFTLNRWGLDLDYVAGRMVKLQINRMGPDRWEAVGSISIAYQSWAKHYRTYSDLFVAAGVPIV